MSNASQLKSRPTVAPFPTLVAREALTGEEDDISFLITGPADILAPFGWADGAPAAGLGGELRQHPEFLQRFEAHARRCLEGKRQHYETCLGFPGGEERHFEVHLYPGRPAKVGPVTVTIRDITERKHTENHLHVLREVVHLLSFSPDLSTAATSILQRLCVALNWPLGEVWLPTPDGTMELFSTAHRPDFPLGARFRCDTAGLTLRIGEGLLAELWAGIPVFIPSLSAAPTLFRAAAAARAGFRSAFAIPLKAGDQTLALMLFFLTGDQSPAMYCTSLAQAVASELGTFFNRERTQEQLDSFFNRSPDMNCFAGFDGFLKRVNPAWTRLLGYPAGELLSRPLVEFIHPEDQPQFLAHLAKLGQGEDISGIEARCVCRDGSDIWTLWSATSLPSQHLVIATCRNITERKHTETAVLQSEEHYRDLFHQAYQMQANLRRMSNRILKIQEQERKRISRDLHDEVGQALTAINMNLAVLRNNLVGTPPDTERRITDTQTLIEQTMMTIHNFSRELRPAMLDDLGLIPALRNYVNNFTERTAIKVRLDIEEAELVGQLDSDRRTVVYRIVQEGLNNVVKHAAAKNVAIKLVGSALDVRLQMDDDGRGFSLADRPAGASEQLGLLGLAERARLVGGEFAIASMPGRGTILHATIPFKSP